jgi:hypothetical protein
MAGLAYCRVCKASYPLNVVQTNGGRAGKTVELRCPMGHADVAERDSTVEARDKK